MISHSELAGQGIVLPPAGGMKWMGGFVTIRAQSKGKEAGMSCILINRMGVFTLLAAMMFCTNLAFAATDYTVRDAHLTSNYGVGDSVFDASHANYWSDKKAPTDDKTYYIPGNRYATVRGYCPGKWVYNAGELEACGETATWNDLRMAPGGIYKWFSQVGLAGKVVIEGTESSPSLFSKGHPKGFAEVEISADFVSDESTSCARFEMTGTLTEGIALPDYTWLMTGDWSNYGGTVIVGREMSLEWRGANVVLPGTVRVEEAGYFTIGKDAIALGTLTMADDAILRVRAIDRGAGTAPATIDDSLVLGKIKVVVDGTSYELGVDVSIPIFRLSAAAVNQGVDLSNVVVDVARFRNGPLPLRVGFVMEDDAEVVGGKIVRLVIGNDGADIYTMNVANGTGESGSAFTVGNENYWVGGQVPQAASTGFLLAEKTICWAGDRQYVYSDLELIAKAYVYVQSASLGFKSIHLADGTRLSSYDGPMTKDLFGDVYFEGDSRYLVYSDKTVNLHGALHGDGVFEISTPTPHLKPIGFMGLYGDNSDFHGRIAVTAKSDSRDPSTTGWNDYRYPLTWMSRYFTVTITNANALGGAYVGDLGWKAFHINCAALVKVLDNVDFTEATRGMFVEDEGQVYVKDGKRFKIGVPLTMGGKLSKSGPGVMELGGEVRFVDGDPRTEPQVGTNILSVAGPLKISSVNAVDGMNIVFAKGATLRLDLHPQGAGMMDTGFKATRWATPFTVNTTDGKIPVEFDDGTPVIDDAVPTYRLPICTVPAAVAEVVQFAIPKVKGRRLVVENRLNSNGTVTVIAAYKTGMSLYLR